MIPGMSVYTFTIVHTILSLVGILAGCVALHADSRGLTAVGRACATCARYSAMA